MVPPDRIRSQHPSREEQFRQIIEMLARGRVKAERREEAKEKEWAQRNAPPQSSTGYQPIDQFKEAAERMRAREEYVAAVLRQVDEEIAAADRRVQKALHYRRIMQRAREALGAERFDRLMAEKAARRRRGKR